MFAVIKTGGKQYRVAANDVLKIEKVAGEVGDGRELAGRRGHLEDRAEAGGAAQRIGVARLQPDASDPSRRSPYFSEEHDMLREQVRRFVSV